MFLESDAMFDTSFDILVVLFFVCFFGVIGYVVVKVVVQWNRNNHSPLINVPATVIAKRADVSSRRYANANDFSGAHGYRTTSSTDYYITFQTKSGERIEFSVEDSEYGLWIEGDEGVLSYQGTRYLGFKRV